MNTPATYYPPSMNDGKHVFVFGSNFQARHGKGAALEAKRHWGAKNGVQVGRQGNAYAIPTKDLRWGPLPIEDIEGYVEDFKRYALVLPHLTFLVTAIGTGLSKFTHEEIAPLFKGAPKNCVLPEEWKGLVGA